MELISTTGTRVHVRDEHAARLLAAGYRKPTTPNPAAAETAPAKPARRKVTRASTRTHSRAGS